MLVNKSVNRQLGKSAKPSIGFSFAQQFPQHHLRFAIRASRYGFFGSVDDFSVLALGANDLDELIAIRHSVSPG
jgi:hypothetical protein